jgi:signal transduction histidine kinase
MKALRRALFSLAGKNVALVAVYVAIAELDLMLGAVNSLTTLVWAPMGLSLAALLLSEYRLAPAVFVGALVVSLTIHTPLLAALGVATGNTLAGLLAVYAMRRFGGFRGSFEGLRDVVALTLYGALLSTLLHASIGVTSLWLAGVIRGDQYFGLWRVWWVGSMLGDLVTAPLILGWATGRDVKLQPLRVLEILVLVVTLVAASSVIFMQPYVDVKYPFQSPAALFPLFAWAAVRFELRGAATACAIASAVAIWGALHGLGPFVRETLTANMLATQTFLGSAAVTQLVAAGAIADRARADRVRENFLAIVSHDLRNPLGAIQMSAASLARGCSRESAARVQKHEDLVARSANRMARLIGDLSDASAIDAGHLSLERRAEDSRAIVKEAMDAALPFAAAKEQKLVAEHVEEARVVCDRQRVLQVLANLLGNAVKFTGVGGTIEVREERHGRAACFSVKDDGPGIEPAQLRRVFDRYWRTARTAGGGTGLGLFIAKGIVEAHGGSL